MPPLPKLRIAALSELAKQLRFLPAKAALRQLEAAETLCAQVETGRTYPEDWIVFRITGYRPEIAEPAMLVGEALRRDLGALIERLSLAAGLTEHRLQPPEAAAIDWLDAPALCARWKISRATLDRLRRRGLAARRVKAGDGRQGPREKLLFSVATVGAFEAANSESLAGAAAFSRIEPEAEARAVRRAARYRRRFGCSLNQAARRIAPRLGRSLEAVRQILRRHDLAADVPIFPESGPIRAPDRRGIEESFGQGRGRSVAGLARRTGRAKVTVYRALAVERAARLRQIDLDLAASPVHPSFLVEGADGVVLSPEPARRGLAVRADQTLDGLLASAGAMPPPSPVEERARGAAYWYLRRSAAGLIAALPRHHPGAARLDEIETRLRWASRLKAALVSSQIPFAIKTVEGRIGRPIVAVPTTAAGRLVRLAIAALIDAADRFDPFKGGRLAAPAGLAVTREVTAWVKQEGAGYTGPISPGRATPRADGSAPVIDDWTRRVNPWQAWLEPEARLREGLARAAPDARRLLTDRYGWADGPPRTAADLAAELGVTASQVSRAERAAVRAILGVIDD